MNQKLTREEQVDREIKGLRGFLGEEVVKMIDGLLRSADGAQYKSAALSEVIPALQKTPNFREAFDAQNGALVKGISAIDAKGNKQDAKTVTNTLDDLQKRLGLSEEERQKYQTSLMNSIIDSSELESLISERYKRSILLDVMGSKGEACSAVVNNIAEQYNGKINFPDGVNLMDPGVRKEFGGLVKAKLLKKNANAFNDKTKAENGIGVIESNQSLLAPGNWSKLDDAGKGNALKRIGADKDLGSVSDNDLNQYREDLGNQLNEALPDFKKSLEDLYPENDIEASMKQSYHHMHLRESFKSKMKVPNLSLVTESSLSKFISSDKFEEYKKLFDANVTHKEVAESLKVDKRGNLVQSSINIVAQKLEKQLMPQGGKRTFKGVATAARAMFRMSKLKGIARDEDNLDKSSRKRSASADNLDQSSRKRSASEANLDKSSRKRSASEANLDKSSSPKKKQSWVARVAKAMSLRKTSKRGYKSL